MEFSINGVKIKVGFLFFWLVAILLCFDADRQIKLALLFSLLHEAGHLFAIIAQKQLPSAVRFGLFGMTIVRRSDTSCNYRQEIITALAGPFVNIICAASAFFFYQITRKQLFLSAAAVNTAIGVFNLMPVFSLDGGRALEAFLKMRFDGLKSERILKAVSFVFVLILDLSGIWVLAESRYNFTLLLIAAYLSVLLFVKC